ncbi:uncharacterized protein [Hetaerina americana]|uniref:uncharacterized protein n=1 Tax=Hetaerina americana TaxID=62018 RepID=UPI003A7F1DA9
MGLEKEVNQGECIPCDGLCHKVCDGVDVIHSGNIDKFHNCTTIQGSVEIRDITFSGFQKFHSHFVPGPLYKEMHPDALEVFSTVKEITGYLSIKGSHPFFKDLSFFRSLNKIKGEYLTPDKAALSIVKTSIKTLGLRSLKEISKGGITIHDNKDLCLLNQNNWNEIKKSSTHSIQIQENRPEDECVSDGYMCHSQCSTDGCWGTTSEECFSCKNYKLKDLCIGPCLNTTGSSRNSRSNDEICFTKTFLPGLSLYILNENTKELFDGHVGDDGLTSAYVTTHNQYQIWIQRLSGNAKPIEAGGTGGGVAAGGDDQGNYSPGCPKQKADWRDFRTSEIISTQGLVSTNDSKCNHYVGRTTHEGDLIPGKFFIDNQELYISWGGKEFTHKNLQLLVGYNYEWIPGTGKNIPPCAVRGGQTVDGTPLYIGRIIRPGDCSEIGKVNSLDGLCYVGYFSKEYSYKDYDILVFKNA